MLERSSPEGWELAGWLLSGREPGACTGRAGSVGFLDGWATGVKMVGDGDEEVAIEVGWKGGELCNRFRGDKDVNLGSEANWAGALGH